VGLGYVACELGESAATILGSSFMIEVAGEQVPARASLESLYDPKSERVRV
jgi:glycine cleavage system aminomethyltransferase T